MNVKTKLSSIVPRLIKPIEWPTLALFLIIHSGWFLGILLYPNIGWLSVILISIMIAWHSSFQHELIHGHPFTSPAWNSLIGRLPVGWFIPYGRFRDLHLAHHKDSNLTDPYDDPESWYKCPNEWQRFPKSYRLLLNFNNTLIGRMVIGPALTIFGFGYSEIKKMIGGDVRVQKSWASHLAGLVPVLLVINHFGLPLPAYFIATYLGLSLLQIRTFLEHRAHEKARSRSVIVENGGIFALLFLNNNLHALHHSRPNIPWYDLPGYFRHHRDNILKMNDQYHFDSYWQIFKIFSLKPKEPVAHPGFEARTE